MLSGDSFELVKKPRTAPAHTYVDLVDCVDLQMNAKVMLVVCLVSTTFMFLFVFLSLVVHVAHVFLNFSHSHSRTLLSPLFIWPSVLITQFTIKL